jgi:hypothetical protein
MKQTSQLAALKVKISKLGDKEQKELLSVLPSSYQEMIEALPPFDPTIFDTLPVYAFIGRIHPSWLQPLFEKLSDSDKQLFVSAFQRRKEELCKAFNIEARQINLSAIGKYFILKNIYSSLLSNPDILPFPFLSQDPFFPILTLSYENLHALIHLLGLYDIAIELPTLVKASSLKAINQILNSNQSEYLKKIQTDKTRVEFEKIGLALWDGNEENFRRVLFKRGLHRLSVGLSRASVSFMKHLLFMFSKEEAKNFEVLYKKKKKDIIIDAIKSQVLHALSYLNETIGS